MFNLKKTYRYIVFRHFVLCRFPLSSRRLFSHKRTKSCTSGLYPHLHPHGGIQLVIRQRGRRRCNRIFPREIIRKNKKKISSPASCTVIANYCPTVEVMFTVSRKAMPNMRSSICIHNNLLLFGLLLFTIDLVYFRRLIIQYNIGNNL